MTRANFHLKSSETVAGRLLAVTGLQSGPMKNKVIFLHVNRASRVPSMLEAIGRFLKIYCPSQAGSADVRPESVRSAVCRLATTKNVKNQPFSTFLRIFARAVRPSRVTDRSG